jgi:hypothetical protein
MAYAWEATTAGIQKFLGNDSDAGIIIVASKTLPNHYLEADAEALHLFVVRRHVLWLSRGYIVGETDSVPDIITEFSMMEAALRIGFVTEGLEFGRDSINWWVDRYAQEVELELTRVLRNHLDLDPLIKRSLTREDRYHLSRDRYAIAPLRGA